MTDLSAVQQAISQAWTYIAKIPMALIAIGVTWVISRVSIKLVVGTSKVTRVNTEITSLLTSFVRFVAWVLGFAAVFNALGMTQVSLALGGSVALIATALATGLNTIPQDLLAGIFLISDDDFHVGKMVKAAGIEGRLEKISIRKAKIRDKDGNLHVVPNRTIDQAIYTIYNDTSEEEVSEQDS